MCKTPDRSSHGRGHVVWVHSALPVLHPRRGPPPMADPHRTKRLGSPKEGLLGNSRLGGPPRVSSRADRLGQPLGRAGPSPCRKPRVASLGTLDFARGTSDRTPRRRPVATSDASCLRCGVRCGPDASTSRCDGGPCRPGLGVPSLGAGGCDYKRVERARSVQLASRSFSKAAGSSVDGWSPRLRVRHLERAHD